MASECHRVHRYFFEKHLLVTLGPSDEGPGWSVTLHSDNGIFSKSIFQSIKSPGKTRLGPLASLVVCLALQF